MWRNEIMNNTQNKVVVSELNTLKEMLEGFCHDTEAYHSDWFDGRHDAYNIVIGYLKKRIDSLEEMA
jgi:hypothetical protein